jgi:hypothetical protein
MTSLFNSETLGEQTPWFGPLIEGYRSVLNTELHFLPPGEFELIVWLWENSGVFVGERVIGVFKAENTVTVDLGELFPDVTWRGGMIGATFRALNGVTPHFGIPFYTRFYRRDGHLAAIINSSNAKNLNHFARTGRKNTYRMCSQQTYVNDEWRPLSWHANVSSDPNYDVALKASVMVFNERGEKLSAPPIVIPPFGALLADIEAIFEGRLQEHLSRTGGRGSLAVTANDGGAIGYHFLQRRKTMELAGDHTRPVWKYLNMGYGASKATTDRSLGNYVRSAKSFLKFRLSA